jgi:hypothetical protein
MRLHRGRERENQETRGWRRELDKQALKRFFSKLETAALAVILSAGCATNIKNASPEHPMAQPKVAEFETPRHNKVVVPAHAKEAGTQAKEAGHRTADATMRAAQEQAQQAIQRFVEFILTGNQLKADEFLRIYDEETLGEEERAAAFDEALVAEFRTRVMDDADIGPIFSAFRESHQVEGGGVDLSEFIGAIRRVREATDSGETAGMDALRQEFSAVFVDSLLARWQNAQVATAPADITQAVPVPVRRESQIDVDGLRAAELFARLIRSGSEPDSEGRTRGHYEGQITTLFTRYRDGPALDASFLAVFMRSLGDMERAVVDEFMHRGSIETLAFEHIGRLMRDIRLVSRDLRAPENAVNMSNLNRAFGSGFVSALQRIVAPPRVMALASIEDLRAKIAAIRDFAQSRGMDASTLSIGGRTLEEWDLQVAEIESAGSGGTTQQRINDIVIALPSADMLSGEEREARRLAERFAALINGTRPFYYNIGESWLSAARSMLAQADDRRAQGNTGSVFSLLLSRELERQNLRLEDSTIRDGEGRTTLTTGIRTIIERVANVLPVLRSARTMLNGDFDEEEVEQTNRMIGELPSDLFPEDVREAMAHGFESAARRAGEARYSPASISSAASIIRTSISALPQALQDRILMGSVSAWDYEVGGADEGASRMDAMDAAYHAMSGPAFSAFSAWVDRFAQTLQTEGEAAPAGMDDETMLDGVMLRDARSRLMNASEIFSNTPLEVRFALYQLFVSRAENGEEGISTEDAGRFAAIVNALSGLPSAYAALLVRSTGPTLLADYDAQSIELILSAINTYSMPLINAGMYRELEEYYSGLGDRIRDLFVDVVALRNVGREQSGNLRDVRVRLPPDRPEFADIYLPASRLMVSLPKRIYERWVSQGMVVQLSQAPDITQGPAAAPSISEIERDFFGRDAITIEMNIPTPMLYLPLVVENLGALSPRYPIPVEEMNELWGEGEGNIHYVTGPDEDTVEYGFSEAVGQRGGGRDWSESVYGRGGDGLEHVVGNVRWNNQPFAQDDEGRSTYLTRGRFDLDVQGTELETLRLAFDGVAPSGTDTAVFFEKEGDEYTAFVFQRFAGGSFALVDARTLTMEDAQLLYEHTFAEQPYRLYGSTRITGADAGGAREDWMVQMDGAVLFAGMPSTETQFQGAGAAIQIGRGGAGADYEETRGRRVGALGAYINPEERDYYVGRVYLSNLEESAERQGVGVHGEFQYFRARRGSIDVFLGSRNIGAEDAGPENIDAGLIASYLGEGWYGGARGGYMMSQMIRPQAEGVVPPLALTTERIAGGTVFAGTDLTSLSFATAVSAVWTQLQEEQPEGVSDEEWQRHIAGALRVYIPAIRTRFAGAGINDEDFWTGGYGIASVLYPLDWMPEINAFGIYLQGEGENEGHTIPIVGGTAEVAPSDGTRFRVQAFGVVDEGGGADLRAFFGQQAGFDFSANGVYTETIGEIGRGVSGALRLRLGDEEDQYRVRLVLAGGYAEQTVGDENITTIEGGGGIRVNLAEPGAEPTLTDIQVGATGIHTEVAPISMDEEERSADQVDVQAGVTVGTTDWSLDATAGAQWWASDDRERLYVTAGGEYRLWSGDGIWESVSVVGRFAGLVWSSEEADAGDFNFSVFLRALNY